MGIRWRKLTNDSSGFVVILEFIVDIFSTVIVSEALDFRIVLLFNLANKSFDSGGCIRFLRKEYDCRIAGIVVDKGDIIAAFANRWNRKFSGQIGVDQFKVFASFVISSTLCWFVMSAF